ncbi:MAG TPA: hypothetical protein VF630_19145 [Hymenobacter sp.]|jgi:hypothetical protein
MNKGLKPVWSAGIRDCSMVCSAQAQVRTRAANKSRFREAHPTGAFILMKHPATAYLLRDYSNQLPLARSKSYFDFYKICFGTI